MTNIIVSGTKHEYSTQIDYKIITKATIMRWKGFQSWQSQMNHQINEVECWLTRPLEKQEKLLKFNMDIEKMFVQ